MSRTLRFRKHTALIASGAMAAVMVPSLFMQGTAQASCSAFTLHGTAHGNDGSALRGYDIAVFVHKHDHVLNHGRTNSKGGFSMRVCKTNKLASYASHHAHRINFDLVAHIHGHRGAFHVRTVSAGYGSGKVFVPSHFVTARTVSGSSSTSSSSTASAAASTDSSTTVAPAMVPQTGTTDVAAYYLHPVVMRIEAVPHMEADYDLSSNSVRNISAKVGGTKSGYVASGEMSIGGSASFASGRTLRTKSGQSAAARVVEPTLAIDGQYTCYTYDPYIGWQIGKTGQCITLNGGRWTGDILTPKSTYHGCASGKAPVIYGTNKNTRYWKVGRGVVYSASVSAGDMLGSVTVSTQYQTGTSVVYRLDQTKAKHRFCLGGNGKYVSTSAALYISSADSTGGGGCASATDSTDPNIVPCSTAAKQD